ncbi:2,3-bisphosphoglycerate-dependent phosphoglycerate mutase, partial [Tetrabaena socialis]
HQRQPTQRPRCDGESGRLQRMLARTARTAARQQRPTPAPPHPTAAPRLLRRVFPRWRRRQERLRLRLLRLRLLRMWLLRQNMLRGRLRRLLVLSFGRGGGLGCVGGAAQRRGLGLGISRAGCQQEEGQEKGQEKGQEERWARPSTREDGDIKSWRLNGRHCGALQGLNKAERAAKRGEDCVCVIVRIAQIQ